MSQFAAELCNLLVTDTFGELYALIFSYLLRCGRQPLPRIVQNTHLSPRQVRHGLAVLIQQHLVYHYTSLDEGVTYYEANWRGAYDLVRPGKIIQLVEERLGDYAAQVISAILYLGHAKVSYLETLPELQPSAQRKRRKLARSNGVNGVGHEGEVDGEVEEFNEQQEEEEQEEVDGDVDQPNGDFDDPGPSKLHPTLRALATYGFISRVRDAQFQSPTDLYEDAERAVSVRPDVRSQKGKKFQEALEAGIETLIKERTDATVRGIPVTGVSRGIKRRAGNLDADGPRKRRKLDFAKEEDDGDEDGYLDDDDDNNDDCMDDVAPVDSNLIVRVNYQKFEVALRNRRLIDLAAQATTTVSSYVYEALLNRLEAKTPTCRQKPEPIPEGEEGEHYSKAIPLGVIVDDLDPRLDFSGSIAGIDPSTKPTNNTDDFLNGDNEEDNNDDNPDDETDTPPNRIYETEQHLTLLAQEPYHFTTRHMHSGLITWVVEWRRLCRRLRHLELERIIESRFGSVAVRVIRVLSSRGKLDEKRLQEISLMAIKELRQILARMESAGFVELQEVPRDAQHQPSRTIYLWFFDADRVTSMVLEDAYKCMARCLQRVKVERGKIRWFLEKTERTDVRGNEERYLSTAELEMLREWREKEAVLLGEVGRLDEVVAVLRDY
ncbi:hypothetical protein AJ80_02774 [Polytolypa hystricis UAMH7299]|uniref:DNA-directed RNA polymerase III subunit RPC3 n=1 Tax=Polytolypa hystricis (strain UAMH7299) TaxID=1447883 RepID=A0A2B7YQ84_POLH7|nr:hypothetical protein AJ80_02774 [Polytolypa hystricis UAMH7299]